MFLHPQHLDLITMEMIDSLTSGPMWAAAVMAVAVTTGLMIHAIVFGIVRIVIRRRPGLLFFEGRLLRAVRGPTRLLIPIFFAYVSLPIIRPEVTSTTEAVIGNVLYVLIVSAVGWLLVGLSGILTFVITRRFDIESEDNLMARKVITQAAILRRLLIVLITVVTIAAILMRFEDFRQIGTGLLASAGVAGIIIGFAAQRTLGNILAGVQIAITQPIRVDDVVVLEGEWGRIEEITLTYVVVRIWDLRRLVLPISYFIEKPFQNWTRTSANILGTAFFYVDYAVPVEAVRAQLGRILDESDYFDGVVWRLHVTEVRDRTVELRAMMSAADSGSAFELRCEVREKMLAFIRDNYPQSLPVFRMRAVADGDDGTLLHQKTPTP